MITAGKSALSPSFESSVWKIELAQPRISSKHYQYKGYSFGGFKMSIGNKNSAIKRVAAALFLTTALSTVTVNSPASAQYAFTTDQAFDAFFASEYNYCDAKMVGLLWNQDVVGGKVTIGQKILNGIPDDVPFLLNESRAALNKCEWADTGYSYDDAEQLARAWNIGSVAEAKWTIAMKMTDGYSNLLRQTLGH